MQKKLITLFYLQYDYDRRGEKMGKKNYNLKERDLQKEGLLITEGALLFERLLASGLPIENIWCSEAVYGKYHREDLPFTVLSRVELLQ